MLAHGVIHLLEHARVEALPVRLVKDGIHEAAALERVGLDAAAGNQGFGGAGRAQAERERARGTPLGDERQRRKRRQQKRLGRAVDKVGVPDKGGGQADRGAVEPDDEDLGVLSKGERRVEVVGGEAAQPVQVGVVGAGGVGRGLANADIGAAVKEKWPC